eukprot:TRINITY_DN20179_c0_g1_i1.p1 TRINITY_DN20179_c0_g1~~TRINITY_DN20179_c0_g1_i1.p1  ORF type:complete len:549 (-),score=109.28 TRINITY_DN20179_c0_g1_i1:159-1805(-)
MGEADLFGLLASRLRNVGLCMDDLPPVEDQDFTPLLKELGFQTAVGRMLIRKKLRAVSLSKGMTSLRRDSLAAQSSTRSAIDFSETSRAGSSSEEPKEVIETMSPEQLKSCLDAVLVIDVRDLDYFVGHIRGSRHFPAERFERYVSKVAEELVENSRTCVIVCMKGELRSMLCARDLKLYMQMRHPSVETSVRVLTGGFLAWERLYGGTGDVVTVPRRCDSKQACEMFGNNSGDDTVVGGSASSSHGFIGVGSACLQPRSPARKVTPPGAEDNEESSDQTDSGMELGSVVRVRSKTAAGFVQAIVVDKDPDFVKVQYFVGKRCCLKIFKLQSGDVQPWKEKEVDASSTGSLETEVESVCSSVAGSASSMPWTKGTLNKKVLKECKEKPQPDLAGSSESQGDIVGVIRISAADLARNLDREDLQVIDVRDEDFVREHVAGARNIPHRIFASKVQALCDELAHSGKTIVFHCNLSQQRGPWCAQLFATCLRDKFDGFNCKVALLTGGFQAWRRACDGSAARARFMIGADQRHLEPIMSMDDLPPYPIGCL